MFTSVRQTRGKSSAATAINIAPLIDVVFILLIFFLVTSTFVRDRGLPVNRPAADASQAVEPLAFRVSITDSGTIYIGTEPVELAQLAPRVIAYARQTARPTVVLVPDADTASGRLVAVLDAVKQAGIQDVAIATRQRDGR